MIEQRDGIAGRIESRMRNPADGVVDDVADRKFEPAPSGDRADDGQPSVRRPVGEFDVVEDRPRRASGDRHLSQRAALAEIADGVAVQGNGELAAARNGEQVCVLAKLQVARLRRIGAHGEDGHRFSAPARAVKNGLAVRRKTRVEDRAAAEGEPLVCRRRLRAAVFAGHVRDAGRGQQRQRDRQRLDGFARPDAPVRTKRNGLTGETGKGAQVEGQVARGLEAFVRIFLQTVPDHAVERAGNAHVHLKKVGRIVFENRIERLDRRLAAKRRNAGQHLVQNHAEGEDVRAVVAAAAAHLFRRHVADRSHEPPGLGRRRRQRRLVFVSGSRIRQPRRGQFGQAEVEDFYVAIAGDEKVLRLEIAMNDVALVRGGQSAGDLGGVIERLPRRHGALPDARAQRLALQQFGDDVVEPAFVADIVDGQDVRMVEHARGARFLLEAPQSVRVGGEIAGEDLDGHVALQARVLRAVHLAHAARADGHENFVRTEQRARGKHGLESCHGM